MENQTEKVEYETRYCKVDLTPEELQEIAERLAMKTQEIDEVESERKSVASSFKERLERIQGEIKSAARMFKDKFEMRDVECVVERDFEAGEVRWRRTDNGQVAHRRKITMGERQRRIEELEEKKEDENVEESNEEIIAKKNIHREMTAESSAL